MGEISRRRRVSLTGNGYLVCNRSSFAFEPYYFRSVEHLKCGYVIFNCFVCRWDPNKRMTPEEAHRHEWFTAAAAAPTCSPAASTTTQVQSPSSSMNVMKCHPADDSSDGIFSASSASSTGSGLPTASTGNNGDRSTMYQIFKSKNKATATMVDQQQVGEPSQQQRRIDGNSNLDDSGTFLPSIL